MRYKIRIFILFIIIGLKIPCFCHHQEYQLKAVFLEQFTRFIEWPDSAGLSDPTQPFIVAVIGENPFGSVLEEVYAERKIKNKSVEIRYFSSLDDMKNCHILFISGSKESELDAILSYTHQNPILTVSDTEGFAQRQVHINFYWQEDNIKFEINEKAVHESGLAMSYILLNLAKIIDPLRG